MRPVTFSNCVGGLVVEPDSPAPVMLVTESCRANIGAANLPLVVAILQDPFHQPAPLLTGMDIISR